MDTQNLLLTTAEIAVALARVDEVGRAPAGNVGRALPDDRAVLHRPEARVAGPARERAPVERFWRADTSKPGTGLGLAIVTALLDASGGTIRLEDAEPNGLVAAVELVATTPR